MISKGIVHSKVHGEVALLVIDNPPVNLLSSDIRQGLADGFSRAIANEDVQILVITGAGRAFVAGADISEFGVTSAAPSLDELFALIDACPKPVVAAINGVALGGGLEVALCCDYRIAAPGAALGLPEVKLGLLPGGGGTQRLPRLIGVTPALELILSGDTLRAARAKELGLVDALVQGEDEGGFIPAALDYARKLVSERVSSLKLRDDDSRLVAARGEQGLLSAAYKAATEAMPGRFALEMIVQSVEAAVSSANFEAGMQVEQRCFRQCVAHPQHKALKYLFFAERGCSKPPAVGDGSRPRPRSISSAVVLAGPRSDAFGARLSAARVELTRLDTPIPASADLSALAGADLVVVGGEVGANTLTALSAAMKADAVLAIMLGDEDLVELAKASSRPEQTLGFKLAPTGRLVEIVRSEATSAQTLATAMKLSKRLRVIGACSVQGPKPGFIGARIFEAFRGEVDTLLARGVPVEQLRRCLASVALQIELDDPPVPSVRAFPAWNDEELLDRCLRAWADEAQRIVEEGTGPRASDIDVICVRGYGFPELLGGPINWASTHPQNS